MRGAIVAVAEGRYAEDATVAGKPVRLWGRCPARTVVAGLGAHHGVLTVSGDRASGAEVRGLAVTGPSTGILVEGARSVTLDEIAVRQDAATPLP